MSASLFVQGITLSSIINRVTLTPSDSEGFIIGSVTTKTVQSYQDDLDYETDKTILKIENLLPVGDLFTFYDFCGNISKEKIQELTQNFSNNQIIGWYKSRNSTKLSETIREGTIHKQLCEFFQNNFFIFGIFSTRHQPPYDLLSMDYKFLYYQNYQEEDLNPMKICKLRIKNLINTSQFEYDEFSNISSSDFPFKKEKPSKIKKQISNTIEDLESFFQETLTDLNNSVEELIESQKRLKEIENRKEDLLIFE
eukprot:gene7155-11468_t